MREAAEEVDVLAGGTLPCGSLLVENQVAPAPKFFGHDRLNRRQHPVGFGLQLPRLRSVIGAGVVLPIRALRRRVADEPVDGRIRELRTVAGPEATFVEKARNGLLAPVFGEELVHEDPDRGLLGVRHKLLLDAPVPKRRRAANRFAKLRPDRNGRGDALCDLLPFPLGHRRDDREKQAAGGRPGIDRLVQRHHVGGGSAKLVREIKKLFGVAGKAGQLAENKPRDVPGPDVGEHPLGLGMLHHRLSAHSVQAVDLADTPLAGFRIHARSLLMDGGAFAPSLVLGADTYPDANLLRTRLARSDLRHEIQPRNDSESSCDNHPQSMPSMHDTGLIGVHGAAPMGACHRRRRASAKRNLC